MNSASFTVILLVNKKQSALSQLYDTYLCLSAVSRLNKTDTIKQLIYTILRIITLLKYVTLCAQQEKETSV